MTVDFSGELRAFVEAEKAKADGDEEAQRQGNFVRGHRHGRIAAYRKVLAWLDEHAVKLDEVGTAPARRTDPATSHEPPRKLTSKNACGKLAATFYRCARADVNLGLVGTDKEGATADDAVAEAGLGHLRCPWKRVSDLKYAGIVEPTGHVYRNPDTGMDQEMLRITAHGRAEVERLGLHLQAAP